MAAIAGVGGPDGELGEGEEDDEGGRVPEQDPERAAGKAGSGGVGHHDPQNWK